MDVLQRVVRLCEGLVGAVVKLKGNVYEVNDVFIGFNCDTQPILIKDTL